jgi:hypothetical protein
MGRSLRVSGSIEMNGVTMPVKGALAKWTPETEALQLFLLPIETTPEMLEGYRAGAELHRILNKMGTRDAAGWTLVPTAEIGMALRKSGKLPPLVSYSASSLGPTNVSSHTRSISALEVSRIPPVPGRDVEIKLTARNEHSGHTFSCDLELAFELEGTPPGEEEPAPDAPPAPESEPPSAETPGR